MVFQLKQVAGKMTETGEVLAERERELQAKDREISEKDKELHAVRDELTQKDFSFRKAQIDLQVCDPLQLANNLSYTIELYYRTIPMSPYNGCLVIQGLCLSPYDSLCYCK